MRCRAAFLLSVLLAGVEARSDWLDERTAALYRPFQADQVALAPDGRHLAHTVHTDGAIAVVITQVDNPDKPVTVRVQADRDVLFAKQKAAAQLRFLRWASADRLIIAPTEEIRRAQGMDGPRIIAPIFGVDADGRNARQLADAGDFLTAILPDLPPGGEGPPPPPRMFWRPLQILGFLPGSPVHLLVEARGTATLPTSLFKVDVRTGKSGYLFDDQIAGKLVADRQGRGRLVYWQSPQQATRTFSHLAPTKTGSWREMDENWGGPVARTFTLSAANYYGERSFPLGFDFDGRTLYYASNVGRDTYGVYAFDTETKQRTSFALEHPHFDLAGLEPQFPDRSLVFDERRQSLAGVRARGVVPFTLWIDPELAEMQRLLEKKFPRRTVEIMEWDDARDRFVVRATGGTEPGRYYVFRRRENILVEFRRRAPWLPTADLPAAWSFEFDTPQGVHLTGCLTLPRQSRLNPPPLLVYFPAGFPPVAPPEFDRETQILAGMGFMVLRVNYRGSTGFGARHRNAIQAGIDRVPLEDVLAAIEWLAPRHPFDRRRIATMGEGFGGYLALRALQLRPEVFRCGVAIDAPLDVETWLRPPVELGASLSFVQEAQLAFIRSGITPLAELSVLRDAEKLTKPVFLMVNPDREDIVAQNGRLRSQLGRLDRPVEYFPSPAGIAANLPEARAKSFRQMEGFFNEHLYDYRVDIGEAKKVR